MRWDLFCRVIDNFGDIGVCWRLARQLGQQGQTVRLWTDDPTALAWMAPGGAAGVSVVRWTEDAAAAPVGDVVVEAFGCDPPPAFVATMAAAPRPAVWINLEYLSAERYVERSHGLPSPQLAGPGRGLTKWFFYPGFGARSGGLLREPGLLEERARFDPAAWCRQHGIDPRPGERRVSLFGYPEAPWSRLPQWLSAQPTLLLLTPGAPAIAAAPGLRVQRLPWLTQVDYDRLLWSCDLNLVRGEDSLVRAIWAAQPFVWQIYPQHDGAHAAKLQAFADRFGHADVPGLLPLWQAWNGLAPWPEAAAPELLADPAWIAWQQACHRFCGQMAAQDDLVTQLLGFVHARRAGFPRIGC